MRAVIMEKKDNHMIVMTKDGQFKKIKKPQDDVEIGMEINIADGIHQNIRRIAAILIVVILMSGLGVSTYAYYTPYGYVNVDINPNVEIIYNRFNRVLKINGMNDDGKNLVESMEHYKYTKVEDTVSKIINQTIEEDKSEETQVLITYDKIKNQTLDLVKDAIQDDGEVNVYTIKMSTNEYEEIKNKGKSPGKAILIKNIIENHSNYTPKELEQKSIKALIEMSNGKIEDEKEIRKEIKKEEKINQKQKNNTKDNTPKGQIKKDDEHFNKNKDDKQSEKESKDKSRDKLKDKDALKDHKKGFDEDNKNKDNIVDINHQNKRPIRYIDYKNEEQVEEIDKDKKEDEKADKADKKDKATKEDSEDSEEDNENNEQDNDGNKGEKNREIKDSKNNKDSKRSSNKPHDRQIDKRNKNNKSKKN